MSYLCLNTVSKFLLDLEKHYIMFNLGNEISLITVC